MFRAPDPAKFFETTPTNSACNQPVPKDSRLTETSIACISRLLCGVRRDTDSWSWKDSSLCRDLKADSQNSAFDCVPKKGQISVGGLERIKAHKKG